MSGLFVPQISQVLQNIEFLLGAENQIDLGDMGDFPGFQLSVATGDNDKSPGMSAGYLTNRLPAFLVGQFGDRASIDHTDVGDFARPDFANTVLFENFPHRGSLGEIEFATQRVVSRRFILKCFEIYHVQPVEIQI